MNTIRITGIAIALAAVVQAEDKELPMLASFDKASGQVSITEAGKPVLR